MKKNNTPNRRGSTGIDKDKPKSMPRPSRLMDNGVKNAIRNNTLSNEKKYNINTPNTIGRPNIRYILFSTTK
jgi:hypothetical protein